MKVAVAAIGSLALLFSACIDDEVETEEAAALGDYCVAYKDSGFHGDTLQISWQRDYNDLHRAPSFGDTMSSIECFGTGSGLYLYKNTQWGGSSLFVASNGSVSNLGTYGFDDSVSSIKWVESSGFDGSCTLFPDTNYGGTGFIVAEGLDWNDFHRALPSSVGDLFSSIQCTNASPFLCRDAPFADCTSFPIGPFGFANDPNLHDNVPSLGDNISSLKWQSL